MLNLTFYFIVFDMRLKAPATIIFGNFEFFLAKSSTKLFKLLNGLSYIAADSYGC
jgi:hypothetical protein